MPDMVKSTLHALKQWFNSITIHEILTEQEPSNLIGDVFVKRTLTKSFLRAWEDLLSSPNGQSHRAIFKLIPSDFQSSKDILETTVNCFEVIQVLLQSSEHEVRLAVLEFIVSHLPCEKHTSLGGKAIVEQDTPSHSADSWTFEKLEETLKSQLFTLAVKVERHTECLVKVIVI